LSICPYKNAGFRLQTLRHRHGVLKAIFPLAKAISYPSAGTTAHRELELDIGSRCQRKNRKVRESAALPEM
jgi:hypothetical protein